MDVSIIIVNYNTCQLTKKCIESVFEKTKDVEFEVILVDNASNDGSKELFEQDPRINYVYSEINLGFGRGNNLGYQYATGDYVFLLNSDTLLINNAIYELVTFMKAHPMVSISGGALYGADMENCTSYGILLPSLKQEFDTLLRGLLSRKMVLRMKKELTACGFTYVGYITGADMMLRRSKIEEMGLFDQDFFMYFEETEMTYRYAQKGYKSAYFPMARIMHLEGKSFIFKATRERLFFSSRKLYYKKTGRSLVYYYICTFVYISYIITSIFKDLLFLKNKQFAYNSIQRIKILLEQ